MIEQHPHLDFAHLPLVLAGPVLRRTEPDAVTVWLALQQPCQITLTVYETTMAGTAVGQALLSSSAATVAIGRRLHLLAITARPVAGQVLESDRIYAYDLQFAIANSPQSPQSPITLSAAIGDSVEGLSYFDHGLPTFILPPTDWHDLKLAHGSCRKPHGTGHDALPLLDKLLAHTAADLTQRPHQLYFTGDQIYGDDVAEPMLWLVHYLGPDLLGWEELLPTGDPTKSLKPGQRRAAAEDYGGLTAALGKKDASKVSSHLLSLGEYLAAYILNHSPTCWPQRFPTASEAGQGKNWTKQVENLQQFARPLGRVRRALANIPVYAIFDDHDVSDDWNLNQTWCLRVYGRPMGYRVVQNALAAYALVQAWGNTPWQFAADQPGWHLLNAVQRWSASGGGDADSGIAIAHYLGLPLLDSHTGLPLFTQDADCFVLSREAGALTWYYTVESSCHQVIALDTRTYRGYPMNDHALAPPKLLTPFGLETQLTQTLQPETEQQLTLVIAPTNVFSIKLIDIIHQYFLRQKKVFGSDVGDAWNLPTEALASLITTLFQQRKRLIVLSGDIHFSFAVHLELTSQDPSVHSGVLVQLTASSIDNEETLTRIIHTRLKDILWPERIRYLQGWINPSQLAETKTPRFRHPTKPDWFGKLTWIPRQPAQSPAFSPIAEWVPVKRHSRWLQSLKFWKSRWFQEGRELIGRNNLSVVKFTQNTVQQDSYWYATWSDGEIVRSRFESEL